MQMFFDTEFIENGKTIDLISIGIVAADGRAYYAESRECDLTKANKWVEANVFPYLRGHVIPRSRIASEIRVFVGENPEFWAYYADYDWVALCQLYGTMMHLPKGWPMYCRDIKQLCDSLGNPQLPKNGGEHNALQDAHWNMKMYKFLTEKQAVNRR